MKKAQAQIHDRFETVLWAPTDAERFLIGKSTNRADESDAGKRAFVEINYDRIANRRSAFLHKRRYAWVKRIFLAKSTLRPYSRCPMSSGDFIKKLYLKFDLSLTELNSCL